MAQPHETLKAHVRQGTVLEGRYRIGKPIGSGAYGAIFDAIDEQTGEQVAIKAIPPMLGSSSKTAMGRFQREMMVIRNMIHPNIISLYDWGETVDRVVYMVLEYIDGKTLDSVVRDNPMELSEAISVTRQIALALQVAHSKGVIHRDLKPANVMLTRLLHGGYGVKVLDFGMAKMLTRIEDEPIEELTREGVAVGTPRYIAPEQARGLEVGPSTDLYALGLLMYEMLTGVQAVKIDTVEGAVAAHVSPKPLQLAEIEMVDPAIRPVMLYLMEKDLAKRCPSSAELLAALSRVDEEIEHRPDTAPVEPYIGVPMGDRTGDFPGATSANAGDKPPPEDARRLEVLGRLAKKDEVDLELDYDRYKKFAPKGKDPVRRRKIQWRGRWFRLPRTGGEWFEVALALGFGMLGFIFITAHFPELDYSLRFGLGSAALLVALVWSLVAHTDDWRLSFWRLCWCLSLVVIVIAHLLGPQTLVGELMRSSNWFLEPIMHVPGVETLDSAVTWVSRSYGRVLTVIGDAYGAKAAQGR